MFQGKNKYRAQLLIAVFFLVFGIFNYPQPGTSRVGETYPDNQQGVKGAETELPPTTPVDFGAIYSVKKNSVELSWSSTDVGPASFEIERKKVGETTWKIVGQTTRRNYSDFYVEPQIEYSYRIRAGNGSSIFSGYSPAQSVKTEKIRPNVIARYGGVVSFDDLPDVILIFPVNSLGQDFFVDVRAENIKNLQKQGNLRPYDVVYSILAKDLAGGAVKVLSRPALIKVGYSVFHQKCCHSQLRLAEYSGGIYTPVPTLRGYDQKRFVASFERFSSYVFTVEENSEQYVFLKIFAWIILIFVIFGAVYYLMRNAKLKKYRKKHLK